MEKYKDFFEEWIEGKGEKYEELREMYNNADKAYEERFDKIEKESVQTQIETLFDETLLEKIDRNWVSYQADAELRKLTYLTKGNILLRKGQYLGEHFLDPHECYQKACVILEQSYDPYGRDFLDLMLQMNLGKYFRNMGKNNQRSDYLRAKDEFEDVREKIEGSGKERLSSWETHIWLEAGVNIGRTERYLYHLKQAKLCLLDMIGLLMAVSGEDISFNSSLDKYLDGVKTKSVMRYRMSGSKKLYEDYLKQAMVQLSIAYQKSQDYKMALDICVAILNQYGYVRDAVNNLGVCLRKQGKDKLSEIMDLAKLCGPNGMRSKYFSMTYQEIFRDLAADGNRFAKLQVIKFSINEAKSLKKMQIKDEIEKLLDQNNADQEVRLIEGIFYQRTGEIDRSQKIFTELYEESSHISKGTIGLKAYSNIANNLLMKQNYREAKKYFDKIEEECQRTDFREQKSGRDGLEPEFEAELHLEDLPAGDLIAEIDKSWCMMKLGDFEAAMDSYRRILELYEKMGRLRYFNKMRIKNNLAECYLHLVKVTDEGRNEWLLEEARKILEEISEEEPYNATTNLHMGYYHKLKSQQGPNWKSELWKALERFEIAEMYKKDDVNFCEGWVLAAVPPLLSEERQFEKVERDRLIQKIENKLRYSSGVYSMKACAMLAAFIQMREGEYSVTGGGERKLEMLYRSLARICLRKNDEGYGLFQSLMEDDLFCRLRACKRGELLVALFQLYGQIVSIKEICRVDVTESSEGFVIPVHYTKVDTLKYLLTDGGRLRLWNTVYMNDSFEGECFNKMMQQVEKRRIKRLGVKGDVSERMKKFFPYYARQSSSEQELIPTNENIYVSSFSELKNEIHMWIPYADDAKGCAVTFADEFFDIRKTKDSLMDETGYSDNDYPLYRIQYLEEDELDAWAKKEDAKYADTSAEDGIPRILDIMERIWEILEDLENRLLRGREQQESDEAGRKDKPVGLDKLREEDRMSEKEIEMVRNFAAKCLNEVRFLIKSSEYSYERELRMLHYSHEPKLDEANFDVPRLYVEVSRGIQIKEVKLGSKISDSKSNEIVSWLKKTGKVERITKSGRHYK